MTGMKKKLNYSDQLNVLYPDGTRAVLVAIAFFRGQKGDYAKAARDLIGEGINHFRAELSVRDRAVFEDILATVRTSESYRKQTRAHLREGSG